MRFFQVSFRYLASVLILSGAAQADVVGCWRKDTMADPTTGKSPHTVILDPATMAPDSDLGDDDIWPDTSLAVTGARRDTTGRSYLLGKLWYRSEPISDKVIATPEDQWSCTGAAMNYQPSDDTFATNVRDAIAKSIKSRLKDPYSVRSTLISTVFRSARYPEAASLACAWFNAKNSMGGYVGISADAFLVSEHGQRIWTPIGEPDELCGKPAGDPFPELGRPD